MSSDDVRPIDAAISRLRESYTPSAGRPSEDADAHDVEPLHDSEDSVIPADELFWPPTGLEPVHGRLARIAYEFAVISLLLLGAMRWTGAAATAVLLTAFLIAVLGYARVRQLLLHASNAIGMGYPRALVWQVASDTRGEVPLILQGRGVFTGITRAEAARLARDRVTSASLFAIAALWIPLTFPLITVLGFTGVLRDVAAWSALLAPPLVLSAAALRLRLRETQQRRKFRVPEAVLHETSAQVAGWNRLHGQLGLQRAKSRSTLELRLAMGGAWLAAFFLLVPIAMSALTTVIPRFVASSAPSSGSGARAGMLTVLERYRLPADSSITAADAGRALQAIVMAGRTESGSPLLQSSQTRLLDVFPNREFTRETNPEFWQDSLFKFMQRGLTPAQRELVEGAARHPGNELLARLARAPAIDIAQTRWRIDMADTVPLHRWPLTQNRPLRDIAHAHVAKAALLFQRGEPAAADTTLREIISAGFVLRNSISALDAAIGGQLVRIGGNALAAFNEANGNALEAGRIRGMLYTSDVAAFSSYARGSQSIQDLRQYVLLRRNPMPARWETFILLQTAAPCLSFYSGVFGPDGEHKEWKARARTALVQTPEDSVYFEMVSKGGAAKTASTEPRCSPRVLRSYRAILMGY